VASGNEKTQEQHVASPPSLMLLSGMFIFHFPYTYRDVLFYVILSYGFVLQMYGESKRAILWILSLLGIRTVLLVVPLLFATTLRPAPPNHIRVEPMVVYVFFPFFSVFRL
jgi:hypothetical protein